MSTIPPRFDVLGLGCTAIDDLLYVASYPPADAKVPVTGRERQCGGLTATALVAAARLGARCAFAGVLGDDELSRFVLDRLKQEGVDVTHRLHRADARPIHSVVIVDQSGHTRTLFYSLDGVAGPPVDWPDEQLIASSGVLFVDQLGAEGMIRAAGVARAAGVPVVADLESDEHPEFPELLAQVDHLIISQPFAAKITGHDDPASAATALWTVDRQVVAVTAGAKGCWYVCGMAESAVQHQSVFDVDVVDTTGCGDVFHGAYAAALAGGRNVEDCLRFAAAAAALKATRQGGQMGIPDLETVQQFLRNRDHDRPVR